jgi:hypothetical protein
VHFGVGVADLAMLHQLLTRGIDVSGGLALRAGFVFVSLAPYPSNMARFYTINNCFTIHQMTKCYIKGV